MQQVNPMILYYKPKDYRQLRLQRQIQDLQRRIAPAPTSQFKRAGAYDDDAQSEFSAVTNESECLQDENILDFKVEDAEFYQNMM